MLWRVLKTVFNMLLSQLPPHEEAVIENIQGKGPFRRRLMELGLLPGTPILRTGQAPLGDPLSFRVRGAVLCLRGAEAAQIFVAPVVARASGR